MCASRCTIASGRPTARRSARSTGSEHEWSCANGRPASQHGLQRSKQLLDRTPPAITGLTPASTMALKKCVISSCCDLSPSCGSAAGAPAGGVEPGSGTAYGRSTQASPMSATLHDRSRKRAGEHHGGVAQCVQQARDARRLTGTCRTGAHQWPDSCCGARVASVAAAAPCSAAAPHAPADDGALVADFARPEACARVVGACVVRDADQRDVQAWGRAARRGGTGLCRQQQQSAAAAHARR